MPDLIPFTIYEGPMLPRWWQTPPAIPSTDELSFQIDTMMRNMVRHWRDDRRIEEINRRGLPVLKGGLESCR